MNNTLRQFVRSILSEITRYEEETGEGYDVSEEIEQLVSTDVPAPYAFTMTQIQKVGINPMTDYDTPAGVYAYPLNRDYYDKLVDNELPFATNAPYCNVLKLNLDRKWLIVGEQGGRAGTKDVMEVQKKVGPEVSRRATVEGKHYNMNNDSKIFDLTYFATVDLENSTAKWNQLLRSFGYVGIYDSGYKVIHPNEPTQLVCLDPSAYQWLNTYETRTVRKYARGTVKKSPSRKSDAQQTDSSWVDKWNYDDFTKISKAKDLIEQTSDPALIQKIYDKFPNNNKPYREVVLNRNTTQKLLSAALDFMLKKFDKDPFTAKESLNRMLKHPNCPPEAWDSVDMLYADTGDSSSNKEFSALSNPKVTEDKVRKILQAIIKMPPEKFFSESRNFYNLYYTDKQNMYSLLMNPNFPQDVLRMMLDAEVSAPDIRALALKNPNLPPEHYKKIVNDIMDPKTKDHKRDTMIRNVVLKPEDAIKLMRTVVKSPLYRQSILMNTNFSAEDLDVLANKFTTYEELMGVISNKKVSDRTLRRIAQHPDRDTRDAAKSKLRDRQPSTEQIRYY